MTYKFVATAQGESRTVLVVEPDEMTLLDAATYAVGKARDWGTLYGREVRLLAFGPDTRSASILLNDPFRRSRDLAERLCGDLLAKRMRDVV